MNKRTQARMAGCILAVSGVLLLAEGYLALLLPKTIAVWKEAGRQLSAEEQLMVSLSQLAQQAGLPVLALLALVFAGSLTWLVVALKKEPGPSAR